MANGKGAGRAAAWAGAASVYLFLYAPMAALIVLSFSASPRGVGWGGFTFDWYGKLFQNDAIIDAVLTSLGVAILTGVLSGVLGLAVGWTLVRGPKAVKTPLVGAVAVPILFPDILLGISLLCFLVWVGFPLGRLSIVLAHLTFGTAYAAVLVRSRMLALDPLLEDAATDLGAGRARTFLHVTLPQLFPALASGMLIAFTHSFDDFIISFFTAGVGATTLPLKIYSMLKFGVSPEVNALSVLILGVSLILVPLAFWLQFRKKGLK